MPKIELNDEQTKGLLGLLTMLATGIQKGAEGGAEQIDPENYVDPAAAYLMTLAGSTPVYKSGAVVSKSTIDDITLDFTRGRTLTEEEAAQAINFIYDRSAILQAFNTRVVNKLVVPIEAKSATRKNLISPEQDGGGLTYTSNRILHNWGINLQLKNIQLRYDIPLQTVVNNMWKVGWENEVANDIATVLANDILLLATYGDDSTSYASALTSAAGTVGAFYNLNKGFIKILEEANGLLTNTYGTITLVGVASKYLTPVKVDCLTTVATLTTNYTSANLIRLMRTMKNGLDPQFRGDAGIRWIMSAADADLYAATRSDLGWTASATNGSNTYREALATSGAMPAFLGYNILVHPDMGSINEAHESGVKNCIILGNPKNIDIAMSSRDYVKSDFYNARNSLGAMFERTFDAYMDVQVTRRNEFVIAFSGAVVETPGILSADDYAKQHTGTNLAGATGAAGTIYPYCATPGAKIYYAQSDTDNSTLTNKVPATTEAACITAGGTLCPEGTGIAVVNSGNKTYTYIRAYKDGYAICSDASTTGIKYTANG